ncbi:DUF1192 domain-containing protein [Rhizobium paknamense]|uniref:Uncharacterized small protein (DUF1192 family) n=1 Tax=Rhizobium paknamense TaxID=1206817 RepID=A0ABU0IIJ7_9HYPH|nr:uncharacterized small protein (DUF1192 family) [Rhizobium paknamense]
MEEDRPIKKPEHIVGSDLSQLSADEIRARITLLQEEIVRLERELVAKASGRAAAEAFFNRKN